MPQSPRDHSTDDKTSFLALFTSAIIEWNNAETAVRALLANTQGGNGSPHLAHWVIVLELGSRSMSQALHTLAHDIYDGEASEHIAHAANFYSRLIEYRNYYVHSLAGVVSYQGENARVFGHLNTSVAKGKLAFDLDELTPAMLGEFKTQCTALNKYAGSVASFVLRVRREKSAPALEKPALPAMLQRTRETLKELQKRNQSPQA